MATKVFKIPDGKGGMTYQIQTPSGEWRFTDEAGNILPDQEADDKAAPEFPIPKAKRQARKAAASIKDSRFAHFSMKIPKEDYDIIKAYVYWQCRYHNECSRGAFILRCAMDVIRKDHEYREYVKKNR